MVNEWVVWMTILKVCNCCFGNVSDMFRDALLQVDPSRGYTEPTCHGFYRHTCVAFLSNSGWHGAELKANRLHGGWPGSARWEDEIK